MDRDYTDRLSVHRRSGGSREALISLKDDEREASYVIRF